MTTTQPDVDLDALMRRINRALDKEYEDTFRWLCDMWHEVKKDPGVTTDS